jgi:predicted DNA-binding transcriptional regulator AlpA
MPGDSGGNWKRLMLDEYVDTEELARRTGTGATTWAKRRMLGCPYTPKYLKIGRSVRYRWSDVEAWLESRQRNSTSEAA